MENDKTSELGVQHLARRRYQDAYLVARITRAIGSVVKKVGVALGSLIIIGTLVVVAKNDSALFFFNGALLAVIVGLSLYVLGVLVSAVGQILMATLDTAVHSSPFLKKEDMVEIMSLEKTEQENQQEEQEEPDAQYQGQRCVSCKTPIQAGVKVCPKCEWTQP